MGRHGDVVRWLEEIVNRMIHTHNSLAPFHNQGLEQNSHPCTCLDHPYPANNRLTAVVGREHSLRSA